MNKVKIYGIKNCDTMKKAFKWLEAHNVEYDFHDYKKSGVPEDVIRNVITQHGWEVVINKRGTTWRKLDDSVKEKLDDESAVHVAVGHSSVIKRPLIEMNGSYILGFDAEKCAKILI